MSYRLIDDTLDDGLGCGASCSCRSCRAGARRYGETYVRDDENDEDDLAAVPAPVDQATERRLYRTQARDCRGVRVLQTLSRTPMTLEERVHFFERKLPAVPRLVAGHRLMMQVMRAARAGAPRAAVGDAIRGVLHAYPELVEFPFPRGYVVGSVEHERAIVRCELSRARWELAVHRRGGRIPGRRLLR